VKIQDIGQLDRPIDLERPARLAIVIPVLREARNIAPLVARLEVALRGIAWEAVFVDDNSPDGTAAAVRAIAVRDPRIRGIQRVGRRGLASAVIEGMLSVSAPFVAVMDGDLQHDETILPLLLRAVEGGADVAIGSRHVAGGTATEGLSAHRSLLSDAGAWLARHLLATPVSDPMSGFFLLRRDLVDDLAPRLSGRGFKILLDILLSAPGGLSVTEIPYAFRPRAQGASKLDTTVMLEFAGLLIDKAMGGLVPLRFLSFAIIGLVGALVHMVALSTLLGPLGLGFLVAQSAATLLAMTVNFALNNRITYCDARLKGAALWCGLFIFYIVCGIGAVANVGISSLLLRDGILAWGLAGVAGALLALVWNYTVSSALVWRAK
jgi:dolichol-phosphate mannosyltransferase